MKNWKFATIEYFNEITKDMKQHPTMTSLFISKDGKKIIELIEINDYVTYCEKDIDKLTARTNSGYKLVGTYKYRMQLVHRLVAQTYKPCIDYTGLEVDHIDGNKDNNTAENLEWVTRQENMQRAWKNGLISSLHYICRYSKKTQTLFTKDGEVQKMTYEEYLKWRKEHGLPVYARMRKEVI